jgi:tRNA threonylcarbamoyladenosine biosynthesis protein TsaB
MRILAIDTSSASGGIAALEGKQLLGHVFTAERDDYSMRFFRELRTLLNEVGLGVPDFDVYAVDAGPGSFTGLRVGLTAVKAWSEVHGNPIAAVSGLQAIAAQALHSPEYVAAVLDGRRGQVFGALFRRAGERLEWVGGEVVMSPAEFIAEVAERIAARGADRRVVFATPAPELFEEALNSSEFRGASVQRVSNDLAPWIGRLGYEQAQEGELVDSLSLDANYIRRSDAESYWKDTVAPSMKTETAIRRMKIEDAPLVSSLEVKCVEAARWGESGYKQVGTNGIEGWVAQSGKSLVGFVLVRVVAGEMEILNLGIDPASRRKKIATRLLTEVFRHASENTVKRIYLEVRESNAGAWELYVSHGFTEHGRRRRYYAEPIEDAVALSKDLTGTSAG